MSGVVAIDEQTIQITLTEQYEPLPEILAGVTFGVYPVEIDTTGTLPLSSSADFAPVVMFENGFRMMSDPEPGVISTIEVFVDDTTRMLDAGDVDMAIGVDADTVTAGHTTTTSPRTAAAFLAMNQTTEPFEDEQLRRAILKALDREDLLATYFPTAELQNGFVQADACADSCEQSIEMAESGVASSGASQIEFTVDFFTSGAEDDLEQRMAEAVVSSLRNVGLKATARGHALEDYGTRIGQGELAMFRFGSVSATLTPDAILAPMFTTEGSDNVSNIADDEIDALIAKARRTIDTAERNALYAEAEMLIFERALVAPLFRFQNHMVLADTLTDASLDADGSLDLSSLGFAASP
jgi:ABC-type transport system substrate-binding protein